MAHVEDTRGALQRLTTVIADAATRGIALRRAVLAAAFEGKLTGLHTDDEVIEELTSV